MGTIEVKKIIDKGKKTEEVIWRKYLDVVGLTFSLEGGLDKKPCVGIHRINHGFAELIELEQIGIISFDGTLTMGINFRKEVFSGCRIPVVKEITYSEHAGSIRFGQDAEGPIIEVVFANDRIVDGHVESFAYIKID